ncbi:MAG: hypothetical protein ACI935_003606 [Moritella dasanensis]|jgi:hypothetical protein
MVIPGDAMSSQLITSQLLGGKEVSNLQVCRGICTGKYNN